MGSRRSSGPPTRAWSASCGCSPGTWPPPRTSPRRRSSARPAAGGSWPATSTRRRGCARPPSGWPWTGCAAPAAIGVRWRGWPPASERAAPLDAEDREVVAALQRLPLAQREALVLHHCLDLPVEAVAVQTGVSVGTVKSRLARGRDQLAALLGAEAPGEERHAHELIDRTWRSGCAGCRRRWSSTRPPACWRAWSARGTAAGGCAAPPPRRPSWSWPRACWPPGRWWPTAAPASRSIPGRPAPPPRPSWPAAACGRCPPTRWWTAWRRRPRPGRAGS